MTFLNNTDALYSMSIQGLWNAKGISMPGEALLEMGDTMNAPSKSRSLQMPSNDAVFIARIHNSWPLIREVLECASNRSESYELGTAHTGRNGREEWDALRTALKALNECCP